MKKISTGLQGFLGLGVHNPIIHTATVTIGWIKLFKKLPSFKEFICIFFHDFGYLKWKDNDTFEDRHPELGAKICNLLFGKYGYEMCICHSREYAYKYALPLSKLCYADKYSNIVLPKKLYNFLLYFGGTYRWAQMNQANGKLGFYSIDVNEILSWYSFWINKNCRNIQKFIYHEKHSSI